MHKKNIFTFLLLSFALSACTPRGEERPDFKKFFDEFNVQGSFVLYDKNRDHYVRYNAERCDDPFIPASSFKILCALIGLELGVIADENTIIEWDGEKHEVEIWNQNHSLKSAMKYSVSWYFQDLAKKIGKEKMEHYVALANYGNEEVSGHVHEFWEKGGIRISQNEQIDFLVKFHTGSLPFSKRAVDIVKQIILLEHNSRYRLHGKTGWGEQEGVDIGWFVGYLEQNYNVYFYAINIESTQPKESFPLARRVITEKILKELKLL